MKQCIWLSVALLGSSCGSEPPSEGPPAAPKLAVDGTLVELVFPDVEVGEPGLAAVIVRNVGAVTSDPLDVALIGAHATDFALVEESSDCAGTRLAPGAQCSVTLRFTPQAEGDRSAALRVQEGGRALELPVRAQARPRRPRLTLTFEGAARGAVQIHRGEEWVTCRATCEVVIQPGVELRLEADTPSTWAGFTGACAAAEPSCTFTPAGPVSVAARFQADPRERLTILLPGEAVLSVDYDPAGNLVVGTSKGVVKLARDGAEVWRRPYAGEARVGAGGVVFVRTAAGLVKLDGAGGLVWTAPVVTGGCGTRNTMARTWAAMPDGGVAIQGPTALVAYNADGTERFATAPIEPGCRGAIAVDSEGRIYTGVANFAGEPTDLRVFSATGAPLPTLERVSGQYHLALASAGGKVAWSSSGHGYVDAGTLETFFGYADTLDPDYRDNGVAMDASGDVVSLYANSEDETRASGAVIRRFAPDGALRWSLTKAVQSNPPPALDPTGVTPSDLDIDEVSHELAIGGTYISPSFDGGWIEIFAEP